MPKKKPEVNLSDLPKILNDFEENCFKLTHNQITAGQLETFKRLTLERIEQCLKKYY